MFKRKNQLKLDAFIEDKTPHKSVLIVTGARQVGKTTLIAMALKGLAHLSLDLETQPSVTRAIDACDDFADFSEYLRNEFDFNPAQKILFIDEAQFSTNLGSLVRSMKEGWDQATVILSGSLISELYNTTARRPVGREIFLEMWPLSFCEFLAAAKQDSLLQTLENFRLGQDIPTNKHVRLLDRYAHYLKVGGLPAVVTSFLNDQDFGKLRGDFLKTYEDDFIRYFSLEDVNLFRRCLQAVADHVGSPSKDTQAVRHDAPGYKKVAGIFAQLEKWKLLIKNQQLGMQPENNKNAPKRYLWDIGILGDLRLKGLSDISMDDIASPLLRTPLGGIIENAVALALRAQFEDNVYGLKTGPHGEIDFAFKQDGIMFPVEVKAAMRFKQSFLGSIVDYLKQFSPRGHGYLLYGGAPLRESIHGVWALPYYLADCLQRFSPSRLLT